MREKYKNIEKVLFNGIVYKVVGEETHENPHHSWKNNYIIEDKDGNTHAVPKHECIIIPDERIMTMKHGDVEEIDIVAECLSANNIHPSDIYYDMGALCIEFGALRSYVHWGDWENDHKFLEHIMKSVGYAVGTEEVIEENGSDSYSSVHFFHRILAEFKNSHYLCVVKQINTQL